MIAQKMATHILGEFMTTSKYFRPEVYESSNGEIDMRWIRDNRMLKISINHTGVYCLLQRVGPGLVDIIPQLFLDQNGLDQVKQAWIWFNS